jgi:hypothetical protein
MDKNETTVAALAAARDEAQRVYREAAHSEAFVSLCEQLRTAGAEHSAASGSARDAEEELIRVETTVPKEPRSGKGSETNSLLDRTKRVSVGIPTLGDLARVIMFDPRNITAPPASEQQVAAEAAAAAEARARNKYFIAVDRFTEQKERILSLSRQYHQARLDCERAEGNATTDGDADALARAEFSSLDHVQGLEQYLDIR